MLMYLAWVVVFSVVVVLGLGVRDDSIKKAGWAALGHRLAIDVTAW